MSRLPAALRVAFVISLGLHLAALFLPEIDPASEPKARPLAVELRPAPPKPPPAASSPRATPPEAKKKPPVPKHSLPRKPRVVAAPVVPAPPVSVAEPLTPSMPEAMSEPVAENEAVPAAAPDVSAGRLPPRGRIRFRVDMGDSGFEVGAAFQEWSFEAGRYRLVSTVETTGLAWLVRSVDIAMESIGRISGDGLQPEAFGIMRSGKKARERALFDWEAMKVRVSSDRDHALDPGAQDLLSFYYQLGFLDIPPGQAASMPLATGKKYSVYRLENLGDERIEIPLGVLGTRHLRAPGENVTEIWLAYEYRLLPVKIRHVDNDGSAFVQVATEILFEPLP
ncbi:MAG: DUF3108 domain-containing protein, partial [Candidatus Accumulibacter sp.]|nr:DUF3108 domain-containing protein [Accumulibacter sp.]